jgi:hypothetical protein
MPKPVPKGPFLVCQKSGKIVGFRPTSWAFRWLLPVMGFFALLWYLIRVTPKPSRALYPCQRVAAPLAWGFMGWLLSFTAMVAAFRKARRFAWQARYGLAAACALVAAVAGWQSLQFSGDDALAADGRHWSPTDPPNTPIGVARGIYPGRVVWARDASATHWDGRTGHWWDASATDQAKVDAMLARALHELTGAKDDKAAWRKLFVSYNAAHDKGHAGYAPGQAIAVKINQNTARDGHALNGNRNENSINGNPHLILALLRQLVHAAGAAEQDIYVYDISRYITDNIFVPCHAEFPRVHFVELDKGGGEGREAAPPESRWNKNVITYSDPSRGLGRDLPPFLVDAAYLINMAIMKNHGDAGPTLLAKNHFGTVHGLNHGAISPKRMGESNPLVDLGAHKDVGEKTVLFMLDTLYAADGPDATPRKWRLPPFGSSEGPGWPASLFLSQDGVAIESVGFDFVNAEWGVDPFTDNYLHEAALANDPPSGKKYGPVSLGVHEHWNNPLDKKYSRNLGRGAGIELVSAFAPGSAATAQAYAEQWRAEVKSRASTPAAPSHGKSPDRKAPRTSAGPHVAAAIVHDELINVGFGNKDVVQSGKAVVGAAGDHWNAPDGGKGEKLELTDVKGGKTGVRLTFEADHTYDAKTDTPFAHGPFENLMRHYLVALPRGKVTLDGLKPGAEYGLYLYSAADPGGNGRATRFTIGDKSRVTTFSSDEKELVEGVNYAAFTVTADRDGKLEIAYAGDNGDRPEGNLNGMQVAPVKKH